MTSWARACAMHSPPAMRIILLSLFAVAACDDTMARLQDARARWRDAAIADYTFDYKTSGFTPFVNLHITVRNGAATGVDNLGGGLVLPPELAPTFDTLFDEVEAELKGDAKVDVTWDPMFGFPVHA